MQSIALKQARQQACSVVSVLCTKPPIPWESTPLRYCRKRDGLQMAGSVTAGPETVVVVVAGGVAVMVMIGASGLNVVAVI